MHYHLLLTGECNLRCTYCGGSEKAQKDISYDIKTLKEFMAKDPEASICFYGGEPTLRPKLIEAIMDKVPAKRWSLQTNGTHLEDLRPEYLQRFHTILVAIDGGRERTDAYRGKGIYDSIIWNVGHILWQGYKGDTIARMVISERSDVFEDVTHLLRDAPMFSNIHWQLDVFWSGQMWADLNDWFDKKYNPGITKLVGYWMSRMEKGEVLGIVPFKALVGLMLNGQKAKLWCGAGQDCFTITPRGDIAACPIDPSKGFLIAGNIASTTPDKLKDFARVGAPCPSCDIYDICGGRCLYVNKVRLWGDEAFDIVCGSVKHLVGELKKALPRIKQLISVGKIPAGAFDYPDGNNNCEIIP